MKQSGLKILIAGDWHSELHEEAVFVAFQRLGHKPVRFPWHQYFSSSPDGGLSGVSALLKKLQNKFLAGPLLRRLNRDFLAMAIASAPDIVFVYRGTHIYPETLREIKKSFPEAVLIGYNNDDPFDKRHPSLLWRHFLKSIPEYDILLAYRHRNIQDFKNAGAKKVFLLRSWFIPWRNHPVALTKEDSARFSSDVVFVGHYEPDDRASLLEEIVRRGFGLKLFGPGYDWDPVISGSPELRGMIPVNLVWGDDYNKAICGSKIALCFLSKLNNDTYTRRCFEIPASGTLMLSEYSDDLASMYKEGIEADFFRSKEELIQKLGLYLGNDALRQKVAKAGCDRVLQDRHDVESRMRQVLDWAQCEPGLNDGK